jgi:hypothetical protein
MKINMKKNAHYSSIISGTCFFGNCDNCMMMIS